MAFSVFMHGVPGTQIERKADLNIFRGKYSKVGVTYVQLNQNRVVLHLHAFLISKKLIMPNSIFQVLDDVCGLPGKR